MAAEHERNTSLRGLLREGAGGEAPEALRGRLGLPSGATDRDVAAALVANLAQADLDRLLAGGASPKDPRLVREVAPVPTADASFLGQLSPSGTAQRDLDDIADVHTLLAVLRAGRLFQRRAAAQHLLRRMENFRALQAAEQKEIVQVLEAVRDVEVAFELRQCRLRVPGAVGKEARAAHRTVMELAAGVEHELRAYWEAGHTTEPLGALSGDWRTQLLLHARELSDVLMAHVAALLEDGSDATAQRRILGAVRYSADPRLVPSLASLLDGGDVDVVIDAGRALSRVDDPRVWPALLAAYERSVVDVERIALGAALGRLGDVRAAHYVRERLRDEDEHVFVRALEALRTTGSPEDVESVLRLLRSADALVATKAAHTLGRIGDGRGLPELSRVLRESTVGAVRAAAEEAIEQIRARLELRGEEPPEGQWLGTDSGELVIAVSASERESLQAVLGGWRHYLLGRLFQLFGRAAAALRYFERASLVRPAWTVPLLVSAMNYAGSDEYAQALAAFRRALDVDRQRVEGNPQFIRALARCFLRRSEQVEKDGRTAIARGLLDEVTSLDLRRVPSSLRFEIGRRHEALRSLGAR